MVIWEESDLVESEEVERVLTTVNLSTSVIDPGPSYLIKNA